MSKKITFSAFGRDSYYHRDWFKKNGFKFINKYKDPKPKDHYV